MSKPPTLLTLPAEIRQEIFYYTLCHQKLLQSFISNRIVISKLLGLKGPDGHRLPPDKCEHFYGTEVMSSMFIVCRLMHAELEDILFRRFVFRVRLTSAREFIDTISPRACALIREIEVVVIFDLSRDESPTQEVMSNLKEKLPVLRKVNVTVVFVKAPFGGGLAKRRIDGFANRIVEFVMGFAEGMEVVVAGRDSWLCKKEIMDVCSDKMEERMVTSKREGLDYDVKSDFGNRFPNNSYTVTYLCWGFKLDIKVSSSDSV
ncbi:uncharacterized protein Bfra_005326 [Botrytis fragariae]|uniref:F-box domain-containing protein n=1 Tax=Botrytis fragariae TaxID=1964551 RepID=A0A8H6AUS3_9HELO|nr:uncharacterized protein Bfra_005326 [Botrytis fragariae]KAF5873859.1 hypothetical protein Bfra_005326 [Botrytis fragariae]